MQFESICSFEYNTSSLPEKRWIWGLVVKSTSSISRLYIGCVVNFKFRIFYAGRVPGITSLDDKYKMQSVAERTMWTVLSFGSKRHYFCCCFKVQIRNEWCSVLPWIIPLENIFIPTFIRCKSLPPSQKYFTTNTTCNTQQESIWSLLPTLEKRSTHS